MSIINHLSVVLQRPQRPSRLITTWGYWGGNGDGLIDPSVFTPIGTYDDALAAAGLIFANPEFYVCWRHTHVYAR